MENSKQSIIMNTTISGIKNLLNKTHCVCIGNIQQGDGRSFREYISKKLKEMGIIMWNHYKKPFITEFDESEEAIKYRIELLNNEEYDKVIEFSPIRSYDLALMDKSDFIIFVYDPDVFTCGSWEEFFTANRIKRPIFFVNIKGKKHTPLWVFWTLKNHHYIYSSIEECLEMIKKINSGEIPLDSDRWRLMAEEYR